MDINSKNELHTRQGMNSRQSKKINVEHSTKNNIVTNDRLTINVNKVYIIWTTVSMHFQLPCVFFYYLNSSKNHISFTFKKIS